MFLITYYNLRKKANLVFFNLLLIAENDNFLYMYNPIVNVLVF